MNDDTPLYSEAHKRTAEKTQWGFTTRILWLDSFLDWVWLLTHRFKLTESNLETMESEIKTSEA